jgi:cytochrome oxidase Cu insertion factor (SCO1/SenC/PrrC family)
VGGAGLADNTVPGAFETIKAFANWAAREECSPSAGSLPVALCFEGRGTVINPVVRLLAPLLAMLALAALVLTHLLSPHAAPRIVTAQLTLAADIVVPANSMPAPELALRDQRSQPVAVSALRGRVVALTFLDSHCKQLCPIEADQLAQVQQTLGKSSPLSLVVVSVAPDTDTPDSARSFAATHGWAGDWHWLLGTEAQLAPVWHAYSIDVKPTTADILHSAVLYLIDKNGYVRAGFVSGLKPDVVARDVRLLAAGGSS